MSSKHLTLLLALAFAVLAAPALYAAPASCPGADSTPAQEPSLADLLGASNQPLYLATPTGRQPVQGGMGSSGKWNVTECEWFWIVCNDGYTDSCCGSVGSCLGYCEEVCGGPCVYVPNET